MAGSDRSSEVTGWCWFWARSPLFVLSWQVETAQLLLDRGADINSCRNDGATALHVAANFGQVGFTQMLLERGARTNDQDPEGETPLHWAVHGQHHQNIRLLLEHGADVNVRRNSGETPGSPSQLASSLSLHEIAELLSEYGTESVKK